MQRSPLSMAFPEIAAQWHPTLNGDLLPSQVSPGSATKAWWLDEFGHEWFASINKRTSGRGCSVCAGKQIMVGVNDLASVEPTIAAQWHPTRNGELTPQSVTPGSSKRAWWRDELGHEWESQVNNRTHGTGCPYCANQKVWPGFNDLAAKNPSIAAQWHPTRNGAVSADMVTAFSGRKAWWLCEAGHEWHATISNRVIGNGCPVCAGQMVVAGLNDMATTHPDLAAEWHPTANGLLTPKDVFAGLAARVWWRDALGHEWRTTGNSRASTGTGCPVCAGQRVLTGFNDLSTKLPAIASEWHPTRNGDLAPEQVTMSNGKKVWWIDEFGHEWQAQIASRSTGMGCPVCSNQQILAGFNDFATTRPSLVAEWHPSKNGELTPRMFAQYSNKKVWWQCSQGHEWVSTVSNRSHGQGCPECADYGFNPMQPGYLYLLEHEDLNALKIGITNVGTVRLQLFQQRGWAVASLQLFENGGDAMTLERVIKRWWREELRLPRWVQKDQMGRMAGWTETVSADEVSVGMCLARIRDERRKLNEVDAHQAAAEPSSAT